MHGRSKFSKIMTLGKRSFRGSMNFSTMLRAGENTTGDAGRVRGICIFARMDSALVSQQRGYPEIPLASTRRSATEFNGQFAGQDVRYRACSSRDFGHWLIHRI